MLKKPIKMSGKTEGEPEHGLEDLISWLARLEIISASSKIHYLRKPEDFLVELCHGMILPKLAVQTDVVSLPDFVVIGVVVVVCIAIVMIEIVFGLRLLLQLCVC